MIDLKRIYPECNADTFLVQLILGRGLPVHCKNIQKVAAALEKFSNKNLFIIGLIDNDKAKNVPTFIKKFMVCEDKIKHENLSILNLPGSQKYLVRLHPAFEKWMWATALACEIRPQEYGFDDIEKLKDAAKTETVFENKDLKKFINAVIQKNPVPIQTLKLWLSKAIL